MPLPAPLTSAPQKLSDLPMKSFMVTVLSTRDTTYINKLRDKIVAEGFHAPADLLRIQHNELENQLLHNFNILELGDAMDLRRAIDSKPQTLPTASEHATTSRSRSPRRQDYASSWAIKNREQRSSKSNRRPQTSRNFDKYPDKPKLWAAVERNDKDAVHVLLEQGEDPQGRFRNWTPSMKAAEENAVDILQMLLDKKANIEACNRKGRTALSFAAAPSMNGKTRRATSVAALQFLLKNGADAKRADNNGLTARDHAIKEVRLEAIVTIDEFSEGHAVHNPSEKPCAILDKMPNTQ